VPMKPRRKSTSTVPGAGTFRVQPRIPNERPSAARERTRAMKEAAKWLAEHRDHAIEPALALMNSVQPSSLIATHPRLWRNCGAEPRCRKEDTMFITCRADSGRAGRLFKTRDRCARQSGEHSANEALGDQWMVCETERGYGGLSPRQYLRGKDWALREKVGREALIDHGVLKHEPHQPRDMSVDHLVERFITLALDQDEAMLDDNNTKYTQLYSRWMLSKQNEKSCRRPTASLDPTL